MITSTPSNLKLRMMALALLGLATGLGWLAQPAHAGPPFGGFVPPPAWQPPPLNPAGSKLSAVQLGEGVFALLSDRPPIDNSGFVVGDDAVLVIDSQLNAEMAGQVLAAVRAVTDKPIRYLVNTNYHGDHTFGNDAFPVDTAIVAHSKTAEAMKRFDDEKAVMLLTVGGDETAIEGVRLRLPDITFDTSLRIDLGNQLVELYHFGHGNTPGDTVVYVPSAKAAWTGNLVFGQGSIPWMIEGGAIEYRATIARFRETLDVDVIIGGHLPPASAGILDVYDRYLAEHIATIRAQLDTGKGIDEVLASNQLSEDYLPPRETPLAGLRSTMQGFHQWNVKMTYLELSAE